jgi:uncharacterized protein (TIRG00374 family)
MAVTMCLIGLWPRSSYLAWNSKEHMKLAITSVVRFLPILLSVVLLYFVVPVRELFAALRGISARDVLLLAGISAALIAVSAVKWQAFLLNLGVRRRFIELFSLYLVGYFVNTFSPSFIGGDVVRSVMAGRQVDRARALAGTFLERYTGILSMLVMALCAGFIGATVTSQVFYLVILAALSLVCLTISIATGWHMVLIRRVPLSKRILHSLEIFQDGLALGLRNKPLFFNSMWLSLVFHFLTIINTAVVSEAIGWSSYTWPGLATVVPLILIVGAIPISPQGLGIQEGAFVYFLGQVGATPAQALAVAMVLRAKSLVLAVLGWLVVLRRPREHPAQNG